MGLAIAVGLGGALGATARYLIDGMVQDCTSGLFPYGTLTVNVIGSLLLGILTGLAFRYPDLTSATTIIGTGLCGGLTTWSTASWETVRLIDEGATSSAIRFTLANLGASLSAAGLGLLLALLH